MVSGHKAVLAEVQAQAIGQGAMKVTPLAVSGAFHTPLMQPAQDSLRKVITGHTEAKGHIQMFVCGQAAYSLPEVLMPIVVS